MFVYDIQESSSRKSYRISEKFSSEAPVRHTFKAFQTTIYWKILGFSVLILSVIGGASTGTVSNFISANGTFIKNAWRSGVLVLYFVVPAAIEAYIYRNK